MKATRASHGNTRPDSSPDTAGTIGAERHSCNEFSALRRRRHLCGRTTRYRPSHPETALPAHLNPPAQRASGMQKKYAPRLSMQKKILLHRPAVRAVIREASVLGIRVASFSEEPPTLELCGQRTVHGPDVRDGELRHRLACFGIGTTFAVNTDDLDPLVAVHARCLRRGNQGLVGRKLKFRLIA
jgi:hypothetical protein